ncbi:MAG: glycosyltransferase, partial [Blastocatellia bacterium]
GLDPERQTVLVSAGGLGVGRVEQTVAALLELGPSVQLIAVCGWNEELKSSLDSLANERRAGRSALKAIGYTTEIDELMAASDLLVGKPGGLTTSEALARGLAFVIVDPVPGQEERNSDHLLEEGVAIRCNNLPVLAYKVEMLLSDKARLARMQAAARKLARPAAASTVIERLTQIAAPIARLVI